MKLRVKYFFLSKHFIFGGMSEVRVIWHLGKYSIFLQFQVRRCTGSYLGFMRSFVVSVGKVIRLDTKSCLCVKWFCFQQTTAIIRNYNTINITY
jgi:hypothetical protein